MTGRPIRQFLRLYPVRTRRAFRWAIGLSVPLSILDFVSMVLLVPVFDVLMAGNGAAGSAGPLTKSLLTMGPRPLVGLAMGVMIARSLLGFGFRCWWGRLVSDAEVQLSSRVFAGYAYAPYAFHLRNNSAELLSCAVSQVNTSTVAGLTGLVLFMANATTIAALGAALFVVSPLAAILVCGYLAAIGFVFILLSKRTLTVRTRNYAVEMAQVHRRGSTVFHGIRELTVAGARDTVLLSIRQSRIGMVRSQRLMLILADAPRMILEVALYGAVLLALLVVLNSSDSNSSMSVIGLYVVAGLRILPAVTQGLASLTRAKTGMALGVTIAAELAGVESSRSQPPHGMHSLPRCADLVLDNVSFSYDDGPPVVEAVDLRIPFGTFVAIIGPSGSGKSTLLNVVLGLLSPSTGRITYGGTAVGIADPEWLRHVAYVPQEVFVLDNTLLNNLALGDGECDPKRAWRALERASLADLVRSMPDGLDTQLGEGGSRLSVGQRQRLGIARALYRDPSVLILDEPTAALDAATEAQVTETIEALSGLVTIIMVAHRIETIASADVVVRVDKGRLESTVAAGGIRAARESGGV